jgi:hypothetical protein
MWASVTLDAGKRLWVIGPGVPPQFVDWNKHSASDSADVKLFVRDQIIDGALTDREHSSGLSAPNKYSIIRVRDSSDWRPLFEMTSLVH